MRRMTYEYVWLLQHVLVPEWLVAGVRRYADEPRFWPYLSYTLNTKLTQSSTCATSLQHLPDSFSCTTTKILAANDKPCCGRYPCSPRLIAAPQYRPRTSIAWRGRYIGVGLEPQIRIATRFVMFVQHIWLLALVATVNSLRTQWRHAIVKRNVAELARDYDYVVGECF